MRKNEGNLPGEAGGGAVSVGRAWRDEPGWKNSILTALCQSQALSCLPPLLPAGKNRGRREPLAHTTLDRESSENVGHEIDLPSSQWSFGRAIL